MDKSLESVQLTFRVAMALTLGLAVLTLSVRQPSFVYQSASEGLKVLQDVIGSATDVREDANTRILSHSPLVAAISRWIAARTKGNSEFEPTNHFSINEISLYKVPDSELDRRVTVGQQVAWVDRIYERVEAPTFMCQVSAANLTAAFNETLTVEMASKIERVTLEMDKTHENFFMKGRKLCVVSLEYEVSDGTAIGDSIVTVEVPATLYSIRAIGDNEVDLVFGIPHLLKEKLGDYEDRTLDPLPAIRRVLPEIGDKNVKGAVLYLADKAREEAEKRKTRIELLGQSLDASLSLVGGALVLLFLLVFLAVNLVHVRNIVDGNEKILREFPLIGLMWTQFGALLWCLMLIALPGAVCYLALVQAVGPIEGQSSWEELASHWAVRWGLLLAVVAAGAWAITIQYGIASVVHKRLVLSSAGDASKTACN